MLDKGVLYDDARCEFEKMFIARALQRTKGNLGQRGRNARPAPQHRGPEGGGVPNQTNGVRMRAG